MRKKVYGFSEGAAGEIGEVLNRYRAGFLGSPAPKSRHRENAPRAAAPAVTGYAGYFRLTVSGSTIVIDDGGDPASSYAGQSDVVANIAKATITAAAGGIYAVLSWSGSTPSVAFSIASSKPAGGILLGISTLSGGAYSVRQIWINNRLVFRAEYLT